MFGNNVTIWKCWFFLFYERNEPFEIVQFIQRKRKRNRTETFGTTCWYFYFASHTNGFQFSVIILFFFRLYKVTHMYRAQQFRFRFFCNKICMCIVQNIQCFLFVTNWGKCHFMKWKTICLTFLFCSNTYERKIHWLHWK